MSVSSRAILMPKGFEAVIFDMDGLLIDSERLWRQAETEVFQEIGVPITHEMTAQTIGMRMDEALRYLFARMPWKEPSKKEVGKRMEERMLELVRKEGKEKKGAHAVIQLFAERNVPMAIASSSHNTLIQTVLDVLAIRPFIRIAHSAEYEPYGKPHPGVYITAAEKLGVVPECCLAFEDSHVGLLAAKAARMKCIAVPEQIYGNDKRFGIADLVLPSLADFQLNHLFELYG
jgi:mannitol-1-/sugar-/sorbitol-6-/2-deoxyglucose-6-phosphatase